MRCGRRRELGKWLAAVLAFAAGAAPFESRAAGPSARLLYVRDVDAASCPAEDSLRRAVAARFGYDPFFPWAKPAVIVQVGHDHGHYRSHVQLVDEQGLTRGTRDLRSDEDECSQLFDATALAISIALDAFATTEPTPPSAPAAAPPPPAAPPEPSVPAPAAAPPVPAERSSPATGRGSAFWTVGADALAAFGASPGTLAGLSVHGSRTVGWFAFEVGGVGAMSAPVAYPVGRVETVQLALRVAPCARWGIAFACAVGEIGLLEGRGLDLDVTATQLALLARAGGRLGLAIPVGGLVLLRVYAEGVFDLDRPTFYVDYHERWTASAAQGTVALGLARRFP